MRDGRPKAVELNESAVLLTGGTSGIGLASAKALARAGVPKLMLVSRSEDRGYKAVEAVKACGAEADVRFFAADVETPEGATAAAAACLKAFGRIDTLVNTVGNTNMPKFFKDYEINEIPGMVSGIAAGTMLTARAVLPSMMERGGGSIMSVSSDAAKLATPGETIIGAGMAAIVLFCRGLANEAKRYGIRVNVLTPSIVRGSPLYDQVMQHELGLKLFVKAEKLAHLGVVEADDLAELVVFLASPASAKLTGQSISITGGISAI